MVITDDTRIVETLPTLKLLIDRAAGLILAAQQHVANPSNSSLLLDLFKPMQSSTNATGRRAGPRVCGDGGGTGGPHVPFGRPRCAARINRRPVRSTVERRRVSTMRVSS